VTPDHRPACIVLGELCLDVHATLGLPPPSLAPLLAGTDVTARGDIAGLPGGTCWLFADALSAACDVVPLLTAVVGADWAGEFLASAATARGWPPDAIARAPGARTDIVATTSLNGSARLMAVPAQKTSRSFFAWDTPLVARLCSEFDVGFAWVSGYLFEGYDATVAEAARALFTSLRDRGIPIVLDLVPHDFHDRVGHLAKLEARIGPVDVVVGELSTLTGLGFWAPAGNVDDTVEAEAGMLACARSAARGRRGAVVQHRVSHEAYAQAVAGQWVGELATRVPVPSAGPRGIGDALAVQALSSLGLIP
jgi:hypothetical protein